MTTELHLFAGIGGGILAGQMLGHMPLIAVEKNKFCREVLTSRFPHLHVHGDVCTFDGSPYRNRIDIVAGGFPCQPFSCAGKMLAEDDPRHLWPEMARIIEEVQPWAELLMGFPEGWTGSELLATPKFQAWRQLHSES